MARGARLPGEAWSPRDWALAQAVELLDRTRCRDCGQPAWLSHDKSLARKWQVVADRCYSCDAISRRAAKVDQDPVNAPEAIKYSSRLVS